MELKVQKREVLGRQVSGLRKKGFIPAELYGKGVTNLHLVVPAKDFKKVFKQAGESTIINIEFEGKKYPSLVHDLSYDRLSNEIASIDFYKVNMAEKIKVKVPMEFVGIAPAIKEKSGILVKALHEIEIESLPIDIPHDIKVNLVKLVDIGQSIYIKDLDIPKNVKIFVGPDTVVATITAQMTEEEELAMQQAGAAKVEEVKVETEEKKADRDAEKAAGASVEAGTASAKPGVAPAKPVK